MLLNVAVAVLLPGDICPFEGLDGVSPNGADNTPMRSVPDAVIGTVPTTCVPTLNVTVAAAVGPPTHALAPFVILAENCTISLYCLAPGVTVIDDVVGAGVLTVMVKEQVDEFPDASV